VPYPPVEPKTVARRFPEPKPGQDVVAVSRSLNAALVLQAYRQGIFPWPVRQGLVPWASPDPRAIFPLDDPKPWPRTVRRAFKPEFRVSFDEAFGETMRACGHRTGTGTWITPDILTAYDELHALGWAHSVEVWEGKTLVGGLYGIALGALFAGESMYHRSTGASKVAFASCADRLRERGFRLFDVQVLTSHLEMLGCVTISRDVYRQQASECLEIPARFI
jgi:leucyl/phenylalanyl-tRNA--protein transferase